ncbi:MAG TPA: pyruvate kinase [bacterium]|jgi:pyruvate kinase|nr:pyruvate kinase [Myxococcales bacterium]HQH80885.1 pyruvate kinase [bacterium]
MPFSNRTKIVATIGPASNSRRVMRAMISAGADIFRINGAHGDSKEHKEVIDLIRSVAKSMKAPIGILFDLPGPKIRLGELLQESVQLKKGRSVVLVCGKKRAPAGQIPVQDKFVARAVKSGSRIFINDGIVELKVMKVYGSYIECKVIVGGEIRSRKGINLPNIKLPIPTLTPKDRKLLDFAIKNEVDYVGLSFVRNAANVKYMKNLLARRAPEIGIISKIEKPEALLELKEIIKLSDAVMIARGDLGVEMPFDKIPTIQKMIIESCRALCKPAITATQMMESMVSSLRPTRAEATDVAMAVWEGTDAVMLSEETSIGWNPAKAVSAMARIALEAERNIPQSSYPEPKQEKKELQGQVISYASAVVADEISAKAIVTPTRSGRTALFISSARPRSPILAPTQHESVARRMNLYWGVVPLIMPPFNTVDEMLSHAEKVAIMRSRFIKKGDSIVIVSGAHGKKDDITRLLEIRTV